MNSNILKNSVRKAGFHASNFWCKSALLAMAASEKLSSKECNENKFGI